MQYNKIKFTVLSDGIEALNSPIEPESEEIEIVSDNDNTKIDGDEFFESFEDQIPTLEADCQVVIDDDTLKTFMDAETFDDPFDPFDFHLLGPDRTSVDCVWESATQHLHRLETRNARRAIEGNGPLTVTAPTLANITAQQVHAFLTFGDPTGTKQSVIFDTGASLAITPDKSDFDGPLSVPTGDLRLGGMANGLRIEGIGTVTWTFANLYGTEVRISGLTYYVPGAKARLLSPQRLFWR